MTRSHFHQPFGAKHKCSGSHSSAPVGAIQFHQQNYPQLHHYTQLENTLNFYAVYPMLCASKISINLLVQKLHVICWWNVKFCCNCVVLVLTETVMRIKWLFNTPCWACTPANNSIARKRLKKELGFVHKWRQCLKEDGVSRI